MDRALMIAASEYDLAELGHEWQWLLPRRDTPLFVSAFGDWVCGNPDGSLWTLSLLNGTYQQIAANAVEYNILNKQSDWLDHFFLASWQPVAAAHGLIPRRDECIGWKLHPLLGGSFDAANLQIFSMRVYQSLMGQIHKNLQRKGATILTSGMTVVDPKAGGR